MYCAPSITWSSLSRSKSTWTVPGQRAKTTVVLFELQNFWRKCLREIFAKTEGLTFFSQCFAGELMQCKVPYTFWKSAQFRQLFHPTYYVEKINIRVKIFAMRWNRDVCRLWSNVYAFFPQLFQKSNQIIVPCLSLPGCEPFLKPKIADSRTCERGQILWRDPFS